MLAELLFIENTWILLLFLEKEYEVSFSVISWDISSNKILSFDSTVT